ncbi:MAG: hypothetical protein DMG93_20265 [Acidobacteria bacterium]|nr:MAG: hypothetical protein DMG93_20265 [Acidobacteriota bacterium]
MQCLLRAIELYSKAVDRLWSNVRLLMHVVRRVLLVPVVKRFGRILQVIVNTIEVDARIGVRLGRRDVFAALS